jgi:hypothetical protein
MVILKPHHFTNLLVAALKAVPAVLEIPSKDNPYDPNADSLLVRVSLTVKSTSHITIRADTSPLAILGKEHLWGELKC